MDFRSGNAESFQKTPKLIKKARQMSQSVEFRSVEGLGTVEVKEFCQLRWKESIIPNTLLSLVTFPLGPLAILVDFATGQLYDCRKSILLKTSLPEHEPICHKSIVIPVRYDDELDSDQIAEGWIQHSKGRGSCHEFIYNLQVKERLLYYNIDYRSKVDLGFMSASKWRELAFTTGVDSIVILDAEKNGIDVKVRSRIYDLHTMAITKTSMDEVNIVLEEDRGLTSEVASSVVSVIPNSLTYSVLRKVEDSYIRSLNDDLKLQERSFLPTYVAAIGASTIRHPKGFEPWDFYYENYVSFQADYRRYDVVPRSSRTESLFGKVIEDKTSFDQFRFESLLNTGPSMMTFFGSISLFGMVGPALVSTQVKSGKRTIQLSGAAGIKGSHKAFLSDNLYIETSINRVSYSDSVINSAYRNRSQLHVFNIYLGYFWPEAKGRVHRAFD